VTGWIWWREGTELGRWAILSPEATQLSKKKRNPLLPSSTSVDIQRVEHELVFKKRRGGAFLETKNQRLRGRGGTFRKKKSMRENPSSHHGNKDNELLTALEEGKG